MSENQPKEIEIHGHRGCRGLMPENTLPAFFHALKMGIHAIELDVVMSADGKVVVSHEPWLNREICLNPDGNDIQKEEIYNLFQMSYDSISRCDCGSKQHPAFPEQQNMPAVKPLLSQVIAGVGGFALSNPKLRQPIFNIEIKSTPETDGINHPGVKEFCEAVVHEVHVYLNDDQFIIQSFDIRVLRYLHENYPAISLAYLIEGEQEVTPEILEQQFGELGFEPAIYSSSFQMLSRKAVKYLHKKGIKAVPWTVNDQSEMKRMLSLNVDGIITDYPDRLLNVLAKADEEHNTISKK